MARVIFSPDAVAVDYRLTDFEPGQVYEIPDHLAAHYITRKKATAAPITPPQPAAIKPKPAATPKATAPGKPRPKRKPAAKA